MRIINLSSGSDGNLTYIESDKKKILLDMGLSCAQTCKRLELIGVKPSEIDGIIISHEHSDHIKGVDVFSDKFNTPIYTGEDVWFGLDDKLKKVKSVNRKIFDGKFEFEDLLITPVHVPHDVKCYGFSFTQNGRKASVVTDIGHMTDEVLSTIQGSDLVYLEANYDREMLLNGDKYPLSLKRRIDGPNGHLSNDDCADVVAFLTKNQTKQIILSHLSKENNTPLLAFNYISKKIEKYGIKEGEDIHIDVATTNPGNFFKLK